MLSFYYNWKRARYVKTAMKRALLTPETVEEQEKGTVGARAMDSPVSDVLIHRMAPVDRLGLVQLEMRWQIQHLYTLVNEYTKIVNALKQPHQ